ncbi:hypothetical protein MUCCIDRAFT_104312 [Mucor lusitanicus CBS 277.49]|uniref:Uncharacterized protein n=1 Tax=Mucor lusitanicus CBS 277.49 TaxID=747725 RepID=A0A168P9H8_MUCCL|nr:hypothetical protein MUCCIDRAFT_104312 [Mucor lusitanicus CBS 277.49]
MNSAVISQIARPAAAVSKSMFEKAHHQVAPLTDSTLYAPQGHVSASASSSNAAATSASANDTTVFTPSVNAVFDD